jgi:hypothetical protein
MAEYEEPSAFNNDGLPIDTDGERLYENARGF